MRKKRLIKTGLWLMAVILFVGCTNEDAVQKTDQDSNKIVANFMGVQKVPNTPAKSRTTATHTVGNPAKVEWEATDRILVKAIDGIWHQSEPAQFLSADHSRANFKLTSGTYGFNPEIRYMGAFNANRIEKEQTQNSPNDFSHLGVSGDFGTATARGGGGDYEFTLEHKVSYLCFLPRCTNAALGPNIKLQQIEVEADKHIAGQGYVFFNNVLMGPYATSANKITLKLNDFPLDNTTTDIDKNGAYMVLEPGTFNLTIRYTIHDATTNVTDVITKKLPNFNCPEGKIKDITANLSPAMPKYCMWDAKYDYWYNHLKADGTPDGNYAQNNTDQRWYHEGSGAIGATESCKDCPNANELFWYIFRGDAHWSTENVVRVENGHLKQIMTNGIWLKKKAKIMADEGITEEQMKSGYPKSNPKDMRTTHPMLNNGPLTVGPAPNTNDYFFLPITGYYYAGTFYNATDLGCYWSSSALPWDPSGAYLLLFSSSRITWGQYQRNSGLSVIAFE